MTADISHQIFFSRHRNILTGLLLAVVAWIIYLPSTQYGYVYYDDVRILRDHPELYGQPAFGANMHAIFKAGFPREEPLLLRDVSWAVDAWIFGFENPFGYHVSNVLLHGLVVALMFVFLLMTTRRFGFALITSSIYLFLAVHVEPVAWIMGRKDILSSLFMLLALCAQIRRLNTPDALSRLAWYMVTFLCFLAALLSKISVLTFPLVLLLHAIFMPWMLGKRPATAAFFGGGRVLKEFFLMMPLFGVSLVVYFWYQGILAEMGIFNRGYTSHGLEHLWNLLMVNPLVFWVYIKQIFLPSDLVVLYAWPALVPTYAPWQVVVSLMTVVGCVMGGIWLFLRRKGLFFYYGAFFVLMIPYLNLIYIGIWVADRYVYFSSFCLLAFVISLAGNAWDQGGRFVRLTLLAAGFGLVINNAFQTIWYQPAWRNGETLWSYHVARSPARPEAFDNLAAYYYAEFGRAFMNKDEKQMSAALKKMQVVVEAGLAQFWPDRRQPPPPSTSFLFFLQSLIQEVTGQPEEALKSLLMSDRLKPHFDSTNLNLSRLYHKLAGKTQDAARRQEYCLAARDRFTTYIKLVYHDRQPPPEITAELALFESECAVPSSLPQNSAH